MKSWYRKMQWFVGILSVVTVFSLVYLPSLPTGFVVVTTGETDANTPTEILDQEPVAGIPPGIKSCVCSQEVRLKPGQVRHCRLTLYEPGYDIIRYIYKEDLFQVDERTGTVMMAPGEEHLGAHTAVLVIEDSHGHYESCVIKVRVS